MSQHSNLKPWHVFKREAGPPCFTLGLAIGQTLVSPFPPGQKQKFSQKVKVMRITLIGAFLGTVPCGADHLATPITAHVVWKFHSAFSPKDVARVGRAKEAEILCGDGAYPHWRCRVPVLLGQGNREGSFSVSTSSPALNSASDGRGAPETS